MTNQAHYQSAINNKNYLAAAQAAIDIARACDTRSGAWAWSDRAVEALTLAGLPDRAQRLHDALRDEPCWWPNLTQVESILYPTTTEISPEPAWQPTHPAPWANQINEQLSRHGHGLEQHERQIADLLARLAQAEADLRRLETLLAASKPKIEASTGHL